MMNFKTLLLTCVCGQMLLVGCEAPGSSDDKEGLQLTFRLAKQSFDEQTNSFLVVMVVQDQPDQAIPMIVSKTSGIDDMPDVVLPIDLYVLSFARSPTKGMIAMTHGSIIGLYRPEDVAEAEKSAYGGRPISAPARYSYNHCVWSKSGTWLAMDCYDLRADRVTSLGLYNSDSNKFFVTDISYLAPGDSWWQDDKTLWVPNNDHAKVVSLQTGSPIVVRQVPFSVEGRFIGVLQGEPVIIEDNRRLVLGTRLLREFESPVGSNAIVTKSYVFAASSEGEVVVYDSSGNLVGTEKVAGEIGFWCWSGAPDAVYAIYKSTSLVKVTIDEEGNLLIKEVRDFGCGS